MGGFAGWSRGAVTCRAHEEVRGHRRLRPLQHSFEDRTHPHPSPMVHEPPQTRLRTTSRPGCRGNTSPCSPSWLSLAVETSVQRVTALPARKGKKLGHAPVTFPSPRLRKRLLPKKRDAGTAGTTASHSPTDSGTGPRPHLPTRHVPSHRTPVSCTSTCGYQH